MRVWASERTSSYFGSSSNNNRRSIHCAQLSAKIDRLLVLSSCLHLLIGSDCCSFALAVHFGTLSKDCLTLVDTCDHRERKRETVPTASWRANVCGHFIHHITASLGFAVAEGSEHRPSKCKSPRGMLAVLFRRIALIDFQLSQGSRSRTVMCCCCYSSPLLGHLLMMCKHETQSEWPLSASLTVQDHLPIFTLPALLSIDRSMQTPSWMCASPLPVEHVSAFLLATLTVCLFLSSTRFQGDMQGEPIANLGSHCLPEHRQQLPQSDLSFARWPTFQRSSPLAVFTALFGHALLLSPSYFTRQLLPLSSSLPLFTHCSVLVLVYVLIIIKTF